MRGILQGASWQAKDKGRNFAPTFCHASPLAVTRAYGLVMVGRGTPSTGIDNGRPRGLLGGGSA